MKLTIEEKIDYIYKKIKKNERNKTILFIIKWWFRIFIFWFLIYFYYFWMDLIASKVSQNLKNNFKNGTEIILEKKDDLINSTKNKATNLYNNLKNDSVEY